MTADVFWPSPPKQTLCCLQECHCMLFLTEDNDFAGKDQQITHDEIVEGAPYS